MKKSSQLRSQSRALTSVATAALAACCLLAPPAMRAQSGSASQNGSGNNSQDSYQGVSRPPADDTIQVSPDASATQPAPARRKPSPGVAAAPRQSYTGSAPASSSSNDPNNPDYGIVTSVPNASADDRPANDHGYTAPPPSRETHLIPRPENPDYGIVEMIPSPSNQLAEGTDIRVRMLQNLSTTITQDGQPFRAQVAADVYKEGRVVIPVGSELRGRVISVTQGHRMGTPATLRLRPEAVLLPDGTSYHLYAQAIRTDAPGTHTDAEGGIQPSSRMQRNLVELGAGSGGGAATGAILGGPAGAAAGALVGAGIVSAHLLLQHPHQAEVEQGSEVTFSLTEPMDLLPTRN